MKNQRQTICAVVVTFNRLELLKECLEAIREQTFPPDALFVIDNGSTDGTSEWLDKQHSITVVRQKNLGGAGGFRRGIKEAFEANFDFIWVMDDDVKPLPDALEVQFNLSDQGKSAVVSRKLDLDGNTIILEGSFSEKSVDRIRRNSTHQHGDQSINFGNFEGMLLSRIIISTVGFPDERFFLCGDDIIYGWKISQNFRCILPQYPLFKKLIKTTVNHKANDSLSRLYFGTRNRFLWAQYVRPNGLGIKEHALFLISLLAKIVKTVIRGTNMQTRVAVLITGYRDGLIGKWGIGSFPNLVKHR